MSVVTSKLKRLGARLRPTKEPDQREVVEHFIADLKGITTSIADLVEDLGEEYEEQVIKERSTIQKTMARLPGFLQPASLREEEQERRKLSSVKTRVITLNASLDQIEEAMTDVPLTQEEVGRRIYEVAYPGQELTEANLSELEGRINEIEQSFFASLEAINTQMATLTQTLTQISEKLNDQGVVLERMDDKLDRVETKVDQARVTLEKISNKLTQNKVLLAFLLGAVVVLVGALVLL